MEGINIDFGLVHRYPDSSWRVGETGLRVQGMTGNEIDDLLPPIGDKLPPLFSGEVDLSLLNYPPCYGLEISRVKNFGERIIRRTFSSRRILKNMDGGNSFLDLDLFAPADFMGEVGIDKNLKPLTMALQSGDHCPI